MIAANRSTAAFAKDTALIADLLAKLAPRAKSLIVTVYGDAIAAHGGTVWLGSLIRLMAELGLGERMVRTAVFRLVKDDWLVATPIGRQSTYGLSAAGRLRTDAAHRRLYAPLDRPWDGLWHQVIAAPGALAPDERERLRRELGWLGFGGLGPNLMAHPNADPLVLKATLDDLGVADRVVVMKSRDDRPEALAGLKALIREGWDLERLSADYQGFLERFRPLAKRLAGQPPPEPAQAFALRVLAMHDFRRVLLRDPMLPETLLPAGWAGAEARRLLIDLYRRIHQAAERHIEARLETARGPLPAANADYWGRFGGLA